MSTQRKRYSAEFKARVALDALKGHKTVNEFQYIRGASHPDYALETSAPKGGTQIFSARRAKRSTTRTLCKPSCISK